MTTQPVDISRLETSELIFPAGDVVASRTERQRRLKRIHKATLMGNLKHEKVHIVFATESNVFQVYTTIWLYYRGCIYLKGDVTIPVERVLDIHFDA
ncbi:MAG: hypothetical protein RL754_1197 [Bacteroidota bacterium]|jgi:hypothetical protein